MKRAREVDIMEEVLRKADIPMHPNLHSAIAAGLKDVRQEKFQERQKQKRKKLMECKGFAEQRAAHGMSQKELADKLGVSQVMVARAENGTKTPPLWMVKKAAEIFGCSTDAVIYGGGKRDESA